MERKREGKGKSLPKIFPSLNRRRLMIEHEVYKQPSPYLLISYFNYLKTKGTSEKKKNLIRHSKRVNVSIQFNNRNI